MTVERLIPSSSSQTLIITFRRMSWRDPALGEKRENITSESELRELFRRAENNPDRKGSIVSNFWSCKES